MFGIEDPEQIIEEEPEDFNLISDKLGEDDLA